MVVRLRGSGSGTSYVFKILQNCGKKFKTNKKFKTKTKSQNLEAKFLLLEMLQGKNL